MKIFNDILNVIKNSNLIAESHKDGRTGSVIDEENIINLLKKELGDCIEESEARSSNDMIAIDPETKNRYHINIKTSGRGNGDNACSNLPLLHAFTDISTEELANGSLGGKYDKGISDKDFQALLEQRKKDTDRDYYFLNLDKKDMTRNPLIRGLKEIKHWRTNARNSLQIDWGKEALSEGKKRSFEQAYQDIIVNGVYKCWNDLHDQRQQGIEIYKNSNPKYQLFKEVV